VVRIESPRVGALVLVSTLANIDDVFRNFDITCQGGGGATLPLVCLSCVDFYPAKPHCRRVVCLPEIVGLRYSGKSL